MGLNFIRFAVTVKKDMRERRRLRRGIQKTTDPQEPTTLVVAPHIPLELLIELMARLHAKSLMRFKCVSKYWLSLFRSSYFCDRFLTVPSRPQPRLCMILFDYGNNSKSLLLSSVPTNPPTSFEFDKDLTVSKVGGFALHVVRGVICFTCFTKARVYNPSTRQLIILPSIIESKILAEGDGYYIFYFLCYDPVNDQYKLLCTFTEMSDDMQNIRSELWVFVLETGGFWKRVAVDFPPHIPNPLELARKGVLYYLAWTDSLTCLLVSFDIKTEEFHTMQVPRKDGDVVPRLKKWVTQIEYRGKVAVFDYTFLKETGMVDLWVVEDLKKKEWSRKTLVLPTSQMHLVNDIRFKPKGTILNGKIMLVPMKLIYPFYVLYYDLLTNDLKKVEIKGIPNRWFSPKTLYFDLDFMDLSESVRYLET